MEKKKSYIISLLLFKSLHDLVLMKYMYSIKKHKGVY